MRWWVPSFSPTKTSQLMNSSMDSSRKAAYRWPLSCYSMYFVWLGRSSGYLKMVAKNRSEVIGNSSWIRALNSNSMNIEDETFLESFHFWLEFRLKLFKFTMLMRFKFCLFWIILSILFLLPFHRLEGKSWKTIKALAAAPWIIFSNIILPDSPLIDLLFA